MGDEEKKYIWMARWWRRKFETDIAVEPEGIRPDSPIDPDSINAVSGQFVAVSEGVNAKMFTARVLFLLFCLYSCQINYKTKQNGTINLHSVPNTFAALFSLQLNICAALSRFTGSNHLCQITCPPTSRRVIC